MRKLLNWLMVMILTIAMIVGMTPMTARAATDMKKGGTEDKINRDTEANATNTKHTYSTSPKYTWTENKGSTGGYSCTATFECIDGDDTQVIECNVSSVKTPYCTKNSPIVYTATCTFEGEKYTCTKTDYIPPHPHMYERSYFDWKNQDDGSYSCTATISCSQCAASEKVECTVTKKVAQEPTCTEKGVMSYYATCTFDGRQYGNQKLDEIQATGHSYGEPSFKWEKQRNGNHVCMAILTCTKCKAVDKEACMVFESTIKEATCTEDGVMKYYTYFPFNGNYYESSFTDATPALGHSYGEPTFTWKKQKDGTYLCTASFTCERCTDIQKVVCSNIEIIGQKDATCTKAGSVTYRATCTFKGKEYQSEKTDELAVIKHTYGAPSFTWKKQENGSYQCIVAFTCKRCNTVQKIPCTVTEGKKKEATCNQDGTIEYKAACTFDGKEYSAEPKIDVVHATGHSYGKPEFTWIKKKDGYTCSVKVTCSKDGDVKVLPCNMSSERTAPTCTKKGRIVCTVLCTLDGVDYTDTKTEEIPALGHNLIYKDNGDGTQTVTCTRCEYSVVEKEVPTQPRNLKASSAGYNSIKVSWDAVKGADSYAIYEKRSNRWKRIADSKGTSYTVKGVTTGQNYTFTVRSWNAKGGSSYDVKGVTAKAVPATPKVYSASAGKRKITVKWKKVDGASGYYVYRKDGSKLTKLKKITNKSTTSWTNTGLKKGKKYTYVVRAYTMVKSNKVNGEYSKSITGKAK